MWRTLWTTRSILSLGMIFAAYYGYQRLSGSIGTDVPLRMEVASELARRVALTLPFPGRRPRLYVANTVDDFQGIMTAQLLQWLERQNVSVLRERRSVIELAAGWETVRGLSLDDIKQRARAQGADLVIVSRVENWTTDPVDEHTLCVSVQLLDLLAEAVLHEETFVEPAGPVVVVSETLGRSPKPATRELPPPYQPADRIVLFGVWMFSGLVLPWLGARVITRAMRSDSNALSMTLVLGYLAGMISLAWGLWASFESQALTWGLTFLLSSAWLGYLEFVCRILDNRPDVR